MSELDFIRGRQNKCDHIRALQALRLRFHRLRLFDCLHRSLALTIDSGAHDGADEVWTWERLELLRFVILAVVAATSSVVNIRVDSKLATVHLDWLYLKPFPVLLQQFGHRSDLLFRLDDFSCRWYATAAFSDSSCSGSRCRASNRLIVICGVVGAATSPQLASVGSTSSSGLVFHILDCFLELCLRNTVFLLLLLLGYCLISFCSGGSVLEGIRFVLKSESVVHVSVSGRGCGKSFPVRSSLVRYVLILANSHMRSSSGNRHRSRLVHILYNLLQHVTRLRTIQ